MAAAEEEVEVEAAIREFDFNPLSPLFNQTDVLIQCSIFFQFPK